MANISYIRILQAIESFASAHMQIKKFGSDFPGQMPNFATEDEAYPILFVSPTSSIFDMNTTTFVVDVYCFDIIQKDRANISTILSDTSLILSDLNRWILDGDLYGIDIIGDSPNLTPIDNALLDYAAGWKMTLTLVVSTYGICEIPFSESPVVITEVNDIVYSQYLTCETLADCDTFTDAIGNLQTQIDNIGPGGTGATGPQGTTGATGTNGLGYSGLTFSGFLNVILGSRTMTGVSLASTQTAFAVGTRIRVSATIAPTVFMEGIITSYTGTTLIFNCDYVNGSGAIAGWNISVAGQVGSQGVAGPQGVKGATGSQGIQGPIGPTGPAGTGNPIVSGYFTPDNNTLTLVDSLGGEVIIQDEINIITKTISEILSLIADRKLIRGVTYLITGVDVQLYKVGSGNKGTAIYLLALENNKLDVFGTGVFYTPKYTDFPIWSDSSSYNVDDRVIWGGSMWINKNGNVGSSINQYELDNSEWTLRTFNKDDYNMSWDKIKYDITNDKIVYRNEKNINEVSFNFEELKPIQDTTGDYCPIEAFQWGRGFRYDEGKQRLEGVGNQKIYNSLNRNINFAGLAQYNIILNNQSFIYKITATPTTIIMSDIELDNGSYIYNVSFTGQGNFRYITLNNASYIEDISLQESYEFIRFNLNNRSYIHTLSVISSQLKDYKLDNNSFIDNCIVSGAINFNMLYDNNASQINTNNFSDPNYYYQINTTIKNTQITIVDKDQDGWFLLGDLPDQVTTDVIGRINGNMLVDTSLGGYVPYVGASQDVELGEFGLKSTSMQFTGLTNSGAFTWNDVDGTADLTLKGGNVTLQIGQEQLVRVVNKTATNITLLESNYQAVRVTGAQGQRLKVDLALATSDALSAETIGLVTETILDNQEGFVTISGLVNKINTTGSLQSETWADGDILYLSPTVAGRITNIKPSAPDHMVIIGYVVYSHAVNGKIFVKVNNGYELDELHNVKITGTPSVDSLLVYGTNSVWENRSPEVVTRQTTKTFFTDFPSTTSALLSPFQSVALASGTHNTTTLTNGVNPGVTRFRSSSSLNSGVTLYSGASTNTGGSPLSIGSQVDYVFRTPNVIISSLNIVRFGLGLYTTSNDLTDGVYIEINQEVLSGKTAKTSVRSQTATTYSFPNGGAWYHARVKCLSLSLIEFSLYNMGGSLLWSDTLTTNIPILMLNPLLTGTSTAGVIQDIIIHDYFGVTYPVEQRGALN